MNNKIRQLVKNEVGKLFEAFAKDNSNDIYIPPTDVANTAQKALNIYLNTNLNITLNKNEGNGTVKSKELANKTPQNYSQIKRLASFFNNNKENVNAEMKKIGANTHTLQNYIQKSPILLSWNLHGGDACEKWVNGILKSTHESDLKKKQRLRDAGGAGYNKGMGIFRTKYDPTDIRITR